MRTYKRGNLFLIILGCIFAVFAGVNGMQGIHDLIYNLFGPLYLGLAGRILVAVQIACIYFLFHWSFVYLFTRDYSADEDEEADGHQKYDTFTRMSGLVMLILFIISAICRAFALVW